MDLVQRMQGTCSGKQALTSAASGGWCKDLATGPEILTASLQCLSSSATLSSNLIGDIDACFGGDQVSSARIASSLESRDLL